MRALARFEPLSSVDVRTAVSRLLFEPLERLQPVEERRARLVACLLIGLIALGLSTALLQLAMVPNFVSTFSYILLALTVLGVAYAASRTRFYRVGALVACAVPVMACIATALNNPQDHVWYSFTLIGVIFATLLFSTKSAMIIAALVFVATASVVLYLPNLRPPQYAVPILVLHAVLSCLLLIGTHHHCALERDRQVALQNREARLARVQREEVLGRMAGGLAHDFNNLLTVVSANVSGLLSSVDRRHAERLQEIQIATDTAVRISRQLLNFMRRQPITPSAVSVSEVLTELAPLLTRLVKENVRIDYECAHELHPVSTQVGQLEQIIINLVVNANQAMANGGLIRIRATPVRVDSQHVRLQPQAQLGDHIALSISDTGKGMDQATQHRAFEPFFTNERNGTGLGLAIVHEIVRQQGGHIVLSSVLGSGTEFCVYLPSVKRC